MPAANCYHGCILWQVWQILQSGVWKAGLWNGSSKTSPLGIWVATSPSAAMDRAAVNRGYAASLSPRGVPNGWDVPVVFGFQIDASLWRQHKPLKNGVNLGRITTHGRAEVSLKELRITQLLIYAPVYENYNKLPLFWHDLQRGKRVLCRTRERCPEDLWKGGHGAPLSCGRTSLFPELEGKSAKAPVYLARPLSAVKNTASCSKATSWRQKKQRWLADGKCFSLFCWNQMEVQESLQYCPCGTASAR